MACDVNEGQCNAIAEMEFGCGEGQVGAKYGQDLFDALNTIKDQVKAHCDCITAPVCEPISLRDLDAEVATRTGYDFSSVNATTVEGEVVGLKITASIESAATGGLMTFTFSKPICALSMEMYDVDTYKESFNNWSIAPDSITPPFNTQPGTTSQSIVKWDSLPNLTTITVDTNYSFDNNNAFGELAGYGFWLASFNADGTVGQGVQVRWGKFEATECPPCFPAMICTNNDGSTETKDLDGNLLEGNFQQC